jgi:hypothetical protein
MHEPEPEPKKPGEKIISTSEPPLRPTTYKKRTKPPAEPAPVEAEDEYDEEEDEEEGEEEDEDAEDADVDWDM